MSEEKKVPARKAATKKSTPKKETPKKEAPKKEQKKEEVEEVEEKAEKKTASKPKRAKRAQIDRNELIPCRSLTVGTLIYISDRTRAKFVWNEYGTVQYIEMSELLDMRASKPRFLTDFLFYVEDEEAADVLGLTHEYEKVGDLSNLDDFFKMSTSDLADVLKDLPKGIKKSIATRARHLVENGELDRLGVIRTLEEGLKIDLKMFED